MERITSLMLIISVSFCFFVSSCFATTKVLFAHSYHKGFFWTEDIKLGTVNELKRLGIKELEVKELYFDAFKNRNKSSRVKVSKEIVTKIDSWEPDYIICTDDDVIEFVCLNLDLKYPVILNGINGIEKYMNHKKIKNLSKPGSHITGVYQTSYYRESLSFVKKIFPKAKTFGVLSDDTTTSSEQMEELLELKDTFPLKFKTKYKVKTFLDWKKFAKRLEKEVDVIFYLNAFNIRDHQTDKKIDYHKVYNWCADNIKKPGVTTWIGPVKSGVLLSAGDTAENQGIFSARIIKRVMEGEKIGEIPIISPPSGFPVINMTRAKMLNVKIPVDIMEVFIENGKIYHLKQK